MGNGGTLILETPDVVADVTYHIHAVKVHHEGVTAGDRMRAVYLDNQPVTIKVGQDQG